MIARDLHSWTSNLRKVKGRKLRRKVHLHHCQPPRNLGGSSGNLLKVLSMKSNIDVLYQCNELVIITVFSAPHEFSQISSMVTEMCTIWWHMDLSVSPITFYGICAGSIVSVNKLLRMIDSDMRVPYLCQVSVGLPTVTMYYWPWSNPLLNKWQEHSGLSVMYWNHEDFVFVVFFTSTKHPLPFNFVATMIFPLSKFTFVNLNFHSITTYLFTLFHHWIYATFPEEQKPLGNSFLRQLQFVHNFRVSESLRP